ncbi:MAG TPA: phage tail tape measure protein [Pyrinomonadaceae bacterium]|nr:phage tail tape measure protein [Pyrinomonadaceae bacterium]
MSSETYQLAILLSLKDGASGGLDRFGNRLREMGKEGKAFHESFEKIRADLNRDLALGGIGLAGLTLLKKGVDEAGNYEEKLLDLRQAYRENEKFSQYSAAQQEDQIKRIMALATDLGNRLQGSTADYVDMFTAMNQSGIDASDTLNGAGKALAYFANVSGAIRKGTAPQLAEDFGSYGKMFDLKGDEYMKAVQMFSAIKDRFNLESGNLIEASKYFFSTAKGTMNLRGIEGGMETAKLFAFAKRYAGREGSEAGTSLDAMITQYVAHKDKIEALAKDKGIKLEFFDAKGNFQGVENMFAQLEKMKALNPEERAGRLNGIFGEQGSRIANAMVEQGVSGWRNVTTEMQKAVDVQTLIDQKMDTYNAKTEALSGSWQNFKATAFTPLMEDAKGFLDTANSMVSSLQKFSAENPGLMKTLGTLALYSSTGLVAYSAFKTLTTGVKLFRIASAISRSEGLLPYLTQTTTAAGGATTALGAATTKATGLRGAMSRLGASSTVKVGVQIGAIIGIEYLLTWIQSEIEHAINAGKAKSDAFNSAQDTYGAFKNTSNELKTQGIAMPQTDITSTANTAWFTSLNMGLNHAIPSLRSKQPFGTTVSRESLDTFLRPIAYATNSQNPFDTGFWKGYDRDGLVKGFKQTAPQLEDSRVMTEFLRQLDTRIPDKGDQKNVKDALQQAFPIAYADALQNLGTQSTTLAQSFEQLSQQVIVQNQNAEMMNQQNQTIQTFGQSLSNLQQPIGSTQNEMINLGNSANRAQVPLNNIANSANNLIGSLNNVSDRLGAWQPPTPQIQNYQVVPNGTQPNIVNPPGMAVGGKIKSSGLAIVHAGEEIVPAGVVRGYKSTGSNGAVINYSPQVTINGGSDEAKQEFRTMLYDHVRDIDRIVARLINNGRSRA